MEYLYEEVDGIKRYHYVYRITNIVEGKHYYGSRITNKDKEQHPLNDLGEKYFSSSTDEDFMKDQKENPQNYKYKIVKTFDNRQDATTLEVALHKKFNVKIHESFYNKSNQSSRGFDVTGIPKSKEHRRKIGDAGRGRIVSEETKEKMRNRIISPETIAKQVAKNTGRKHSLETKLKWSIQRTGVKRTPEQCENIRIATLAHQTPESIRIRSDKLIGRKRPDHVVEGMKERRKNVMWVYNPTSNIRKLIDKDELENYLLQGFIASYGISEETRKQWHDRNCQHCTIYDSNNIIQFDGELQDAKIFCKNIGLPYAQVRISYINLTKVYTDVTDIRILSKLKNSGRDKFVGWYAIKKTTN